MKYSGLFYAVFFSKIFVRLKANSIERHSFLTIVSKKRRKSVILFGISGYGFDVEIKKASHDL